MVAVTERMHTSRQEQTRREEIARLKEIETAIDYWRLKYRDADASRPLAIQQAFHAGWQARQTRALDEDIAASASMEAIRDEQYRTDLTVYLTGVAQGEKESEP